MKLKWLRVVALLVLAVSLALLVWGFWPVAREKRILPVDPSNLTLPTPGALSSPPPAAYWIP